MRVFLYFSVISFFVFTDCKTLKKNHESSLNEKDQKIQSITETLQIPPPPVSGTLLKVIAINIEETELSKIPQINVKVMKDEKANYVNIWICEVGNDKNCTISQSAASESATGELTLYEIPAQSFTVFAKACSNPNNLISKDSPCGEISSEDFVSSVFPLNSPEKTQALNQIQTESKNILNECKKIYTSLETYLATNPDLSQLSVLAMNQTNMTSPQICEEYMKALDLSTETNTQATTETNTEITSETSTGEEIPSPSPTMARSQNFWIAVGLGVSSTILLLSGLMMYDHHNKHYKELIRIELNENLKDKNSGKALEDLIEENIRSLKEEKSSLEQQIEALKSQISQIQINPNNPKLEKLKSDLAAAIQSKAYTDRIIKENEVRIEQIRVQKKAVEDRDVALNAEMEEIKKANAEWAEKRARLVELNAKIEEQNKGTPKGSLSKLESRVEKIKNDIVSFKQLGDPDARGISKETYDAHQAKLKDLNKKIYATVIFENNDFRRNKAKSALLKRSPPITTVEGFAQLPLPEKMTYLRIAVEWAGMRWRINNPVGILGGLNELWRSYEWWVSEIDEFKFLQTYESSVAALERSMSQMQGEIDYYDGLEDVVRTRKERLANLRSELEQAKEDVEKFKDESKDNEALKREIDEGLKAIDAALTPEQVPERITAADQIIRVQEAELEKIHAKLIENRGKIAKLREALAQAKALKRQEEGEPNLDQEIKRLENAISLEDGRADRLSSELNNKQETLNNAKAKEIAIKQGQRRLTISKMKYRAPFIGAAIAGLAAVLTGTVLSLAEESENQLKIELNEAMKSILESKKKIDAILDKYNQT